MASSYGAKGRHDEINFLNIKNNKYKREMYTTSNGQKIQLKQDNNPIPSPTPISPSPKSVPLGKILLGSAAFVVIIFLIVYRDSWMSKLKELFSSK